MRLNVRKFAAEQFCHALDRQAFDDINVLTSAVVAFAREPFGILVGENRSLRFKHRTRDDIFGSDQLDFVALPAKLKFDGIVDLGVSIAECTRKEGLDIARAFRIRRRRHSHLLAPRAVGADR